MDQSKTYLLKTRYKRRRKFRKANRKLTACADTLGSLSFALGIQPVFNSIRYKGRRKFRKANRKLTACADTLGSLSFALGIQPVFNSTRYKERRKFHQHSLPSTSSPMTLLSHLKSTASQNTNE